MISTLQCLKTVSKNARLYSTISEPPIMNEIRQKLKLAMKSGDSVSKDALRSIMSAVKNANISKPDSIDSDIKVHGLVSSLISKRNKAIEEFQAGNRADLVEKEQNLIKVLDQVLNSVKVATSDEIDTHITKLVSDMGIDGNEKSSFGKVMAKIPWTQAENEWKASQKQVAESVKRVLGTRSFSTYRPILNHDNPLGIPGSIPRRRPPAALTRRPIPGVKRIVAISSAKGGVGKSTVAVNTAIALYNRGLNVGILDIDIFGPSIPYLLNLKGEPRLGNDGKLIPMENYGIKAMSMGFLVDEDKSIAWRGLLVQKALQQLIFDVNWGNLDVLVLDMPPGTGDVQLTLAQQVEVNGAVIVSTPQDLALIDAVRGMDLFAKVKTPVLGLVENMSVFICPNCHHETHIFGHEGVTIEAKKRGFEILASVPLHMEIRTASDSGKPVTVIGDSQLAKPYTEIAEKITKKLDLES